MTITRPNYDLSASDYVRILSRHAMKVMLAVCLATAATLLWIVFGPKQYESTAKAYVRVGHENNTLDPSATTGQTVNIEQTLDAEINSMLEIIHSRETLEKVLDEIGVDTILADDLPEAGIAASERQQKTSWLRSLKSQFSSLKATLFPLRFEETSRQRAMRALQQQTDSWSPKKSSVIHVSCTAGHPELARQIAQSWMNSFIQEHLRVTRTTGSHYFFVRQSEELQKQLLDTENALKDLKTAAGLVSVEGQRRVLETQLIETRNRATTNRATLEASRAKFAELQSILNSISPRTDGEVVTAESHQGWNALREKLFELQVREFELKSMYSDINPIVIAVERQRQEVEKILAAQSQSASETINTINPTYQRFQQEVLSEQALVISLMAEEKSLTAQMSQIKREIEQLNDQTIQIAELERQRATLEKSYLDSATRTEQARILEAMATAQVSSVGRLQDASFNPRPSGLGRLKTLLLGMFGGLVLGTGLAAISEYFSRSLVIQRQVEQALELPVLAALPAKRRPMVEVS